MDEAFPVHPRSRPRSVLVADGDPNVRAALRLLLARDPALRVVHESQDVTELLRDAAAVEPELVLLDWDLPGLLTSGAVAELRRLCPAAALIALSTRDEQRPRALAAGAAAFVGKSEPPARLVAVLRAAAPGQSPRATTPSVASPASL